MKLEPPGIGQKSISLAFEAIKVWIKGRRGKKESEEGDAGLGKGI